jgi:hypothetical protein
MASDIISKKTRYEFREHFTGMVLRQIELEFDSADIACAIDFNPNVPGQRRSLVEQYYHSIDFAKWGDVRKLLKVYEAALTKLKETIDDPHVLPVERGYAEPAFTRLCKCLDKDGFAFQDGRIVRTAGATHLAEIAAAAAHLNVPELQLQLDRLRNAVDDDPGLAIGTAKELIETVCKTILTECGVAYNDSDEVPKLVKETRKQLELLPEQVPAAAKGADTIRTLLSNLAAVASGLAELRNLYGTGHGRGGRGKGLSARHARLAVGAASTLAMFLMETHAERKAKAGK